MLYVVVVVDHQVLGAAAGLALGASVSRRCTVLAVATVRHDPCSKQHRGRYRFLKVRYLEPVEPRQGVHFGSESGDVSSQTLVEADAVFVE